MLSRGLIANEIVRRVDPRGRTIGEMLRYHISQPLGAQVYIGLTEEGQYRYSWSTLHTVLQSVRWRPKWSSSTLSGSS